LLIFGDNGIVEVTGSIPVGSIKLQEGPGRASVRALSPFLASFHLWASFSS
jgi:hypothetical protein